MSDFHFIRPLWLLTLIALFITMLILKKMRISHSGWQQVLPKHLAKKLIDNKKNNQPFSLVLPFIIGLLTIIALAGPTWVKLPQPVFNVARGSVIIMDMSNSMYATDLSPNRLTRSRYKALDLLDHINEGDIGLIAYAGDSFIISPLTQDINNIKLLLPSLSPELMPVQGSNPYSALIMAHEMLNNAGHLEGDIYWFTDGIDRYDSEDINDFSQKYGHKLNILGVGTQTGAPIKMPNGQLLKDDNGAIVVPNLTMGALQGLAMQGRGRYQTLSNNNSDIEALIAVALTQTEKQENLSDEQASSLTGDKWQEAGPYLIIILLLLVLSYFRRGVILSFLPCLLYISFPDPVYANDEPSTTSTLWNNLWQTQNQQAQQKFNQQDYGNAAAQFNQPMWQGSAHYRNGDYEQALNAFKQDDSAQALYNQGNSLAKLQQLEQAIEAYEQALKKDPNLEAAKQNKALIEALKDQQQDQQQQDGDSSEQDKNDEQDQQEQQSSNEEQQSQQNDQSNTEQNSQDESKEESQEGSQENDNEQNEPKDPQQDASKNAEQSEQNQKNDKKSDEAVKNNETSDEDKIQEQQASPEKLSQEEAEEAQKLQQLLNKVTDDPYLLLRNKMQLEYKKRRHQSSGVTKQW
jgi:Ca-activated chloride channel family protein